MTWATIDYSKSKIDQAGRILAGLAPTDSLTEDPYLILNNLRTAHAFPLNTLQINLRRAANNYSNDPLIAQRLKRVPSIINKIRLNPNMNLSRMQDIGGCRAVVNSIKEVNEISRYYAERSRMKHILTRTNDYIASPKASGYRSLHMVYKYNSDRNRLYNGQSIEVQVRTRVQHSWATAIEMVDTFQKTAIKSSKGPKDWQDYFRMVSSGLAYVEGTNLVPGEETDIKKLRENIRVETINLDVFKKFDVFKTAVNVLNQSALDSKAYYYLLTLKYTENTLAITTYHKNQIGQATNDYIDAEKKATAQIGTEVVLVSADSIEALERAYPNYFFDTSIFLESLRSLLNE